MTNTSSTATHHIGPIEARPASGPGALAHHAATCSCGLVMASSMGEQAVKADMRQHLDHFGVEWVEGTKTYSLHANEGDTTVTLSQKDWENVRHALLMNASHNLTSGRDALHASLTKTAAKVEAIVTKPEPKRIIASTSYTETYRIKTATLPSLRIASLKAPRCSALTHKHRLCANPSKYLFSYDSPIPSRTLCARHGSPTLSASALPPSLTIATWNPAKADDGWFWDI